MNAVEKIRLIPVLIPLPVVRRVCRWVLGCVMDRQEVRRWARLAAVGGVLR